MNEYITPVLCTIPKFSKTNSNAEELGMEVEYIGKKIAEISRELTNAKIDIAKISKLYDERECYIDELEKRPARLKAEIEGTI